MKQFFLLAAVLVSSTCVNAQVGIGTTTPKAFFNVADDKDVLFGASQSGSGEKLIWNPAKSAFRVGSVDGTQWDDSQVGTRSFGIGYNTLASSFNTFAIGFRVTASGNNSTAMGNNVSTNNYQGSMILGDYGGYVFNSTAGNQLTMRFNGGYMLYTDSSPQSSAIGVRLASNGNAWLTISDSTRKEKFRTADGASFLRKIARMRLGSWNYKGQDAKQYRHYGPMAQDFFAAFGHDEIGTIGEEKSINQADFDGVNLIAIQALINENQQLKARLATVEEKEQLTQARLDKIEAALQEQTTSQALTLKP